MNRYRRSAFWSGAHLLWRHRRVLAGVYALNLLLAVAATLPAQARLSRLLDHSPAAARMYSGVDVSLFAELMSPPEGDLATEPAASVILIPASAASGVIFLGLMVFLGGGILTSYGGEAPLTGAQFFGACGAFMGRFLRLSLLLVTALLPLLVTARLFRDWSTQRANASTGEALGLWLTGGRMVLLLVVLMAVRLWFDMAQVYAVAHPEERAMRRSLGAALKLTVRNFGSLSWLYVRISLVAWVGLAAAVWAWASLVRPEWTWASFILGQAALGLWLAGRLWQRSSEVSWYQQHALSEQVAPAPAAPAAATPAVAA